MRDEVARSEPAQTAGGSDAQLRAGRAPNRTNPPPAHVTIGNDAQARNGRAAGSPPPEPAQNARGSDVQPVPGRAPDPTNPPPARPRSGSDAQLPRGRAAGSPHPEPARKVGSSDAQTPSGRAPDPTNSPPVLGRPSSDAQKPVGRAAGSPSPEPAQAASGSEAQIPSGRAPAPTRSEDAHRDSGSDAQPVRGALPASPHPEPAQTSLGSDACIASGRASDPTNPPPVQSLSGSDAQRAIGYAAGSPLSEPAHSTCGTDAQEGGGRAPTPVLPPEQIAALFELQYLRRFYIQTINRQSNATKALVRVVSGWQADADEADREAINKRAARIVTAAFAAKPVRDTRTDGEFAADVSRFKPEDQDLVERIGDHLLAARECIRPAITKREAVEVDMERIAKAATVWPWAESVRGFSARGLAVIIGEAGDLADYDDKRKLWKRFGLAPMDGYAMSTWRIKGGLSAEDWTRAGYAPQRLAQVFGVVTAPLMRAQRDGDPYRGVYVRRRERTALTHSDWTKAHFHNDAMRIMTKALVADLWSVWRRPGNCLAAMPRRSMAAAESSEAAK